MFAQNTNASVSYRGCLVNSAIHTQNLTHLLKAHHPHGDFVQHRIAVASLICELVCGFRHGLSSFHAAAATAARGWGSFGGTSGDAVEAPRAPTRHGGDRCGWGADFICAPKPLDACIPNGRCVTPRCLHSLNVDMPYRARFCILSDKTKALASIKLKTSTADIVQVQTFTQEWFMRVIKAAIKQHKSQNNCVKTRAE